MTIKDKLNLIAESFKRKTGTESRLPYLEVHLCDHCNLNCKGCAHFCPLVEKETFLDLKQYKKDMAELSRKIKFDRIRLLGGEPLLHPQINEFMAATRKAFPFSYVQILTNGTLLPQMKAGFWAALKKNNIIIDISKYPAVGSKFGDYLDLIDDNGAALGEVSLCKRFTTRINFKGDSNVQKTYDNCPRKLCTTLWQSKLYPCEAAYRPYANDFFKINLSVFEGLDIYKLSGQDLVLNLLKPGGQCRFCETVNPKTFPWEKSQKKMDEWG